MVVVAAVDQSNRAETVVKEAKTLGDAFGDPVHVVHVVSRSRFIEMERTEIEKTGHAVDVDRIREYARSVAEEASETFGDDIVSVGLVGDTADEVLAYADEHDARYVVVGPRKRSPTGKVLFGSVAQSILLESERPVVSIRPRDDE
ncbi:universal stress protein [Salinigranum rubrum]|uniref:Universal stress protein n=1 Tax=Salinigranum rubrum TaxID=755307 RepID=A0A2I8VFU4_9EURY|nr:universal stress protein [Salinigranum rubrum]AUV80796.1 universal stress protein [Salinigranum rubrum]